jgi:hypothetical protein
MEIIIHRQNLLNQLISLPRKYGVEIDIRSSGSQLILQHDPFVNGENFIDWISHYGHGTLILNLKEEGLESNLIDIMSAYGIENYFFLDQSFPFLLKFSEVCQGRAAVRVSEFESIDTAIRLAGKIKWVWIDCFSKFPLGIEHIKELKLLGYKLCLVSPELHGRNTTDEIVMLMNSFTKSNIFFDAVCTKYPHIWEAKK